MWLVMMCVKLIWFCFVVCRVMYSEFVIVCLMSGKGMFLY